MKKKIKPEKIKFDVVKCIKSGDGYIEGNYYPSIGWNNGMGVQRTDYLTGDCVTTVYASIEDGLQSFSGDGAEFEYVSFMMLERGK